MANMNDLFDLNRAMGALNNLKQQANNIVDATIPSTVNKGSVLRNALAGAKKAYRSNMLRPITYNPIVKKSIAPIGALATGYDIGTIINLMNKNRQLDKQMQAQDAQLDKTMRDVNTLRERFGLDQIDLYGNTISQGDPRKREYMASNRIAVNPEDEQQYQEQQQEEYNKILRQYFGGNQNRGNKSNMVKGKTKQVASKNSNSNSGLTSDELLALSQAQAQARQNIYQPYLNALQNTIDNSEKMIRDRNIDSHISAGMAGLANNPYIYSAYRSRDPFEDAEFVNKYQGTIASTRDKLRYDPTQSLANMQVAGSMGMPEVSALADADFVGKMIQAQNVANENAYRQGMLGISRNELAEQMRANRVKEYLTRKQIEANRDKLDNATLNTFIRSAGGVAGYSGVPLDQYGQYISPYMYGYRMPQVQYPIGNTTQKNALEL